MMACVFLLPVAFSPGAHGRSKRLRLPGSTSCIIHCGCRPGNVVLLHLLSASLTMPLITNGISLLQTNQYNSPCWPSCHGHALPPSWLKACNPARNGGAHDHRGVYHGVVLRGR